MSQVFVISDSSDLEKETLQNTILILLMKLGGEAVLTPEEQRKLKNYRGVILEQISDEEPPHFRLTLLSCAEEENSENEHLSIRTRH